MPITGADASEPAALPTPAESDYRRLFTLSLDLLCIAGIDGHFKQVNPSWTRVLGWSEAELLARPIVEFMHPEDRVRTLQARAHLAKGTPVRGLENRYLCKDGSYRWLSWQSTFEPDGKQVFGVARDVTERRQLDHEQLIMSKLESTGILAGGIAHDFNNLLAGVLLNLDMVGLIGSCTDQQKMYLRQAQETILTAKTLTSQLLAFADSYAASRTVTDLKPLLLQSLAVALTGGNIRGESTLASDLWQVEVDQAQLGQVFRQLVLNAREASAAIGARVRIQAENLTYLTRPHADLPAGDYVRIRVVDEGTGIPAPLLPKVFDPYFSTKQRGAQKGMGLGLTICRSVIQKHGGAITIESEPGLGTTVICHLPAFAGPTPS